MQRGKAVLVVPKAERKKANREKKARGTPNPPSFISTVHWGKRIRFSNTQSSIVSTGVTVADLLDLFCFATSATSALRLCDAVKLKFIEIWFPYDATTKANNIASVVLSGTAAGLSGDSQTHGDHVLSTSRTGHIYVKVTPKMSVGQFQNISSTNRMFFLVVPPGAVIDVGLTFSLNETGAAGTAVAGTVSGATTGVVYVRPLNSSQSSTVWLVPDNVATV